MRTNKLKNCATDLHQENLLETARFFQPQLKFPIAGPIHKENCDLERKILMERAHVKTRNILVLKFSFSLEFL